MNDNLTTFLIEQNNDSLTKVIQSIALGCCQIAKIINQGATTAILNNTNNINIQGEIQQELDIISNRIILEKLKNCPFVAQIVSEEEELIIDSQNTKAPYLVAIDPLDGSSNIKVNVSVGTIFMIMKNKQEGFVQKGRNIVASGYFIYGPSTDMILSLNGQVNLFTLNDQQNNNLKTENFLLTRNNIKIPKQTAEFAINMSNYYLWQKGIRKYIKQCLKGENGKFKKKYNMRWVASMVADIHRILNRGGVFLYPLDQKIEKLGGRLRLLYECNPMAHIIENAGGLSSTGEKSILEIKPNSIHQRIPTILGSFEEVKIIEKYYQKYQ